MIARTGIRILALLALPLSGAAGTAPSSITRLIAEPADITLRGPQAEHGLLISAVSVEGRWRDVGPQALLNSADPRIVAVSADGRLRPVADGETEVSATFEGHTAKVKVRVEGARQPEAPSFRHEVVPLLTRYGCNQGACHGKEAGQNGFKLSLRGYAPDEDFARLILESSGRRINRGAPALSLLLAKAAGTLPHKGGALFAPDSRPYGTFIRWIESGTPALRAEDPALFGIEILGGGRELSAGQEQRLLVLARFADGSVRDISWLCQYYINDATVLELSGPGRIRAKRQGATAVRAHYQDRVAVVTFSVPNEKPVDPALYVARHTEIDRHVFERLAALRIPPSGPASDEDFLRRVYVDTIGTLPTADEAAAWLADPAADKRTRLVDQLLARPEFTDYWAQWMGDLFQNRKERDHDVRGPKGIRNFHAWLRGQVAKNRPWNELARDVMTATGDTRENPQIGFWVVTVGEQKNADRSEAVASVAQTFLGTRILCAKCHNHPDEKYTQDDYYHFAAFFTSVSLDRQKPDKADTGLAVMSPAEQEQRKRIKELEKQLKDLQAQLEAGKDGDARKKLEQRSKEMADAQKRMTEVRKQPARAMQPRTGRAMEPQPLDRVPVSIAAGGDPRATLADWMTDPKNEYFSGSIINRIWKHYLGTGLVESVDDLRSSNPPSNPALWKHLNDDFVRHGYDLKRLMREILRSRVYQLSSATLPENELDRRFYSRYYPKRLSAEVLLDAMSQVTGIPDRFDGYPVGLRAVQLPDPLVESHFLRLFGRSERVTACACERSGEVTLPQLLHLQNGEGTVQKIRAADGRLEALLKAKTEPMKIVETLFLSTLSRPPRDAERSKVAAMLAAPKVDPAEVLGDLLWALFNTKEFVFNH